MLHKKGALGSSNAVSLEKFSKESRDKGGLWKGFEGLAKLGYVNLFKSGKNFLVSLTLKGAEKALKKGKVKA